MEQARAHNSNVEFPTPEDLIQTGKKNRLDAYQPGSTNILGGFQLWQVTISASTPWALVDLMFKVFFDMIGGLGSQIRAERID